MSTEFAATQPTALILSEACRSDADVIGSEPGEIVHLSFQQAAVLQPWPSRPVVLLASLPPGGETLERLATRAGRGRNPAWLVLATAEDRVALEQAWRGISAGVLTAPIDVHTLRYLSVCLAQRAELRRERDAARRECRDTDRKMTVLSETLRAAASFLDPGMVSQFIMQRAAALVRSEWWRLYRLDENRGALRLDARVEPPGTEPPPEWLPVDQSAAGLAARTRETVHIKDPERDSRFDRELEWPGRPPRTVVAVPLSSRGRVIGVASLADPATGRFSNRDIDLLQTLMEPAALALDNAQLFRKLEERTVTDDLTQLYNARFMENYLRREAKRAVRYGHPVALLFIDLDGFKQVNDVHGHMAGSSTLVEVGEVLRANVREIDVVARWGGDEFAVVLPDTVTEGAAAMAERIRACIEERSYLVDRGLDVRLSASIGVAAFPEHGRSAEALLAGADAAMYRVKNGGKNGVALARPAETEVLTTV